MSNCGRGATKSSDSESNVTLADIVNVTESDLQSITESDSDVDDTV